MIYGVNAIVKKTTCRVCNAEVERIVIPKQGSICYPCKEARKKAYQRSYYKRGNPVPANPKTGVFETVPTKGPVS